MHGEIVTRYKPSLPWAKVKRATCANFSVKIRTSLLSATPFRSPQQPYLLQDRLERGW